MDLQQRIVLMGRLGEYMLSNDPEWLDIKQRASVENAWFIPPFIDQQVTGIAHNYLDPEKLQPFAVRYLNASDKAANKTIGLIMAGNIPLVGFHDFLCVFISGHTSRIKVSSKDNILFPHLVKQLTRWEPAVAELVRLEERLNNCDAYIATGSNNSSRYFEYYFSKYPHIIRKNRTSVAILDGNETIEQLGALADDVYMYFGLGCRNVTKLYVPKDYDFVPLLESFKKYNHLFEHHKYKNNYDYQLAILIINRIYYMTNGSIILREDPALFSPISELNYEFYTDQQAVRDSLSGNEAVQCIVGKGHVDFGQAQSPSIDDFADGVDVMAFLRSL